MSFSRVTKITALLALVLVTAGLSYAAEGDGHYFNVSNERFATISNGPQNAIILKEGQSLSSAFAMSGSRAAAAEVRYRRQLEFLRQAGLIAPWQGVEIDQTVIYVPELRPQVSRSRAQAGGGTLNFVVDSAKWSSADRVLLQKFVQIAYPAIVSVYGAPAQSGTVTIVQDNSLMDRDWFAGGVYELPANIIHLPRYSSNKSLQRSLLHLMIHAFHGQARFSYDAWEEGFARAASVVVGERIDPQLQAAALERMDFITEGGDAFYYLMPVYDLLNQPALGNNMFLTKWTESIEDATARFGGMLIPRLGMSSTAWLKVYVEALRNGVQFFARFNELYYAQWTIDNNIGGNVPKLKEIAASVTTEVEGLPFNDWYQRQYVLDTSVTNGKKLYAYTIPVSPESAATDHYTAYVFLMHYITTRVGDEQPISGYCYPVYWNHQYNQDIWLGGQYEEIQVIDGEGYLAPTFTVGNIGGSQRVTMDFTMNDLTTRVHVPIGLTGTEKAENSVYGVVAGAGSGALTLKVDNDPAKSLTVARGGFASNDATASLGWSVLTVSFNGEGKSVVRRINKGPGRYAAVLDVLGSVRTLPLTLGRGWHKLSVPGASLERDQAAALGIHPNALLLARWQPDILGAYKYMMYPIAPAFQAGWGYWLKANSDIATSVSVKVEDQSAPWRIGLMPGWNQIGCPFVSPAQVRDLQIEVGNFDPTTYDEARASGIVGPIFAYHPDGFYVFATALEPLKGYWIKCNEPGGAVLTVPGPAAN